MHVHLAADRVGEDSPATPLLTRALQLMSQVIDEGRNAVRGLRSPHSVCLDLEQAFAGIQDEVGPEGSSGRGIRFRVIAEGKRRALHPLLRDRTVRTSVRVF